MVHRFMNINEKRRPTSSGDFHLLQNLRGIIDIQLKSVVQNRPLSSISLASLATHFVRFWKSESVDLQTNGK